MAYGLALNGHERPTNRAIHYGTTNRQRYAIDQHGHLQVERNADATARDAAITQVAARHKIMQAPLIGQIITPKA